MIIFSAAVHTVQFIRVSTRVMNSFANFLSYIGPGKECLKECAKFAGILGGIRGADDLKVAGNFSWVEKPGTVGNREQ